MTVLAHSGNNAATGCTHNCTPEPSPTANIPNVNSASSVGAAEANAPAPAATNARHAQHVNAVPKRSLDTPAMKRPPCTLHDPAVKCTASRLSLSASLAPERACARINDRRNGGHPYTVPATRDDATRARARSLHRRRSSREDAREGASIASSRGASHRARPIAPNAPGPRHPNTSRSVAH